MKFYRLTIMQSECNVAHAYRVGRAWLAPYVANLGHTVANLPVRNSSVDFAGLYR